MQTQLILTDNSSTDRAIEPGFHWQGGYVQNVVEVAPGSMVYKVEPDGILEMPSDQTLHRGRRFLIEEGGVFWSVRAGVDRETNEAFQVCRQLNPREFISRLEDCTILPLSRQNESKSLPLQRFDLPGAFISKALEAERKRTMLVSRRDIAEWARVKRLTMRHSELIEAGFARFGLTVLPSLYQTGPYAHSHVTVSFLSANRNVA